MGRGGRTGLKQRGNRHVRKKMTDSEDSDEDYVAKVDDVDDLSDALDSFVADASEEESWIENEDEDEDEDEVYVAEEEEEEEYGGESEWRTVAKPKPNIRKGSARTKRDGINRPKKRRKFVCNDTDDSDYDKEEDHEEEEEEEEKDEGEGEWRTVVKPRPNVKKGSARTKRNGTNRPDDSEDSDYDNEEDHEEEEEEEDGGEGEWRTVVKPRPNVKKGTARTKRNGINRPKKRRKVVCDDNEDSDDDDDEEFTPDEIEFLEEDEEDEEEEEEEFPPAKTRTNKRGRTSLKRKNSLKSNRTKRRTKVAKKSSRKKTKRTRSVRRKAKSGDDEDFTGNGRSILRGTTGRKPGRRKKRVTTGSGSDFRSDSSDYDFTISEEEREQVREANEFCRTLATNLRSSRRTQEDETFYELKKPPARKGKEKAEETKNDTGKPVCGICLTEEGKKTVRGMLNCCSHYFCFACIMEWSKVETRCPLCKQRFATISKPTRCSKGFDLRDSVIAVPERDQVYQPSEEELRDFLNPYENVICTECHHGGDDALMLLCDVCDSPAHTYCVGLGREVPDGNWYCDGCRPAALASLHSQTEDFTPEQRAGTGAANGNTAFENMAEIDLNVTIPEPPVSQGNGFLPSPRFSGGGLQSPSAASGMGVSTVSGRRRIHRQIQYILSNRRSQNGGDISSLGNLIGLGFHSTFQQSGTADVGTSQYAQQVNRFQEISSHDVQNREFFSGRPGHMTGLADRPSTASDGSAHHHGHLSSGAGQAQSSAGSQLRPCTSRSSIEPDISVFPSHYRAEDRVDSVKHDVYSMVDDQLRNMTPDINMSYNIYLEISQRSANSILAAYGLEPPRPDAYQTRPPRCLHVDDRLANVASTPLSGCCLACIQDFAKDVIRRTMDIVVPPHWSGFR